MARPWFRMYSEFVSDPKVQLLAFEDQRHFVALLCLKCNDTLDSEAPTPMFRDRMIAKALGLGPDAALEAKRRLLEVGLIDSNWQPISWESRQYEHDVSTSRVKDWRAKKRSETFQKRSCNVSETTEIQNRPDTEQTRSDQSQSAREAPDVPRGTFDGWKFIDERMRPAYPRGTFRHTHWIQASRLVEGVMATGATPDEIIANVEAYCAQVEASGNAGTKYVMAPTTFLTDENWRGPFPLPAPQQRPREESPMDRIQRLNSPGRVLDGEVLRG